jgi:hypothetical protein
MFRELCLFGKILEIFCLFGKSLENFAYSAKVSNLGKFWGFFWSNLTKNSGDGLFFCFTSAIIKSLFIQSDRPQLSTIWQKSRDLYLFGKSLEMSYEPASDISSPKKLVHLLCGYQPEY